MRKSRQTGKENRFIYGCGNIIVFLSLLFVLVLLWMALVSTSVISPDYNEHTYFTESSVFWILLPVGLMILIWKMKKTDLIREINENEKLFQRILMVVFLILAGILSWWILYLSAQPKADQQLVMETVRHMRFGDFIDFEKGGYVSMNHQQYGIVCVEYLLSFLLGSENYLALQLCNVPGVILCYFLMERIVKETGGSQWQRLMTVMLCLLFFPFSMYVVFVYGTVWGMAFALGAVYLEIRFFHERKWQDLVLSVISIGMAVFLKSNYEIFAVGMMITGILETIREKKAGLLLLPLLVMGMLAGEHGCSEGMIHHLAGDEYAPSMSTWTWIAMGTSENTIMADGWYSDAIGKEIYREANGDLKIDEILTREIVQNNRKIYQDHPERFLQFLLKKTASQWNNPTFQGFWIVQRAPHQKTRLTENPFVRNAYRYLKGIQILILTGAILDLLLSEKRKPEDLILLLIFAGGFVFHLFWEAKCQYTVVYFLLLIPYAVDGYRMFAGSDQRKRIIPVLTAVVLLSCVLPYVSADVRTLQKDAWPAIQDTQDPYGFTS